MVFYCWSSDQANALDLHVMRVLTSCKMVGITQLWRLNTETEKSLCNPRSGPQTWVCICPRQGTLIREEQPLACVYKDLVSVCFISLLSLISVMLGLSIKERLVSFRMAFTSNLTLCEATQLEGIKCKLSLLSSYLGSTASHLLGSLCIRLHRPTQSMSWLRRADQMFPC